MGDRVGLACTNPPPREPRPESMPAISRLITPLCPPPCQPPTHPPQTVRDNADPPPSVHPLKLHLTLWRVHYYTNVKRHLIQNNARIYRPQTPLPPSYKLNQRNIKTITCHTHTVVQYFSCLSFSGLFAFVGCTYTCSCTCSICRFRISFCT